MLVERIDPAGSGCGGPGPRERAGVLPGCGTQVGEDGLAGRELVEEGRRAKGPTLGDAHTWVTEH